jgi:hypothetical protein
MFLPGTSVTFRPASERASEVPFQQLLDGCLEARFDRTRCAALIEAAEASGRLRPGLLDAGRMRRGERFATDALLFPRSDVWELSIDRDPPGGAPEGRAPRRWSVGVPDAEVASASAWLRDVARGQDARDRAGKAALEVAGWVSDGSVTPRAWPRDRRPGVYRREHASVLVRSETTSVLIDPIALAGELLPMISEAPAAREEDLDAILVSHSHGDHWHVPSLLLHAARATKVVVPFVPRVNLLTPVSFGRACTLAGLDVVEAPWDARLQVGDIEVDVLPFFGEQPTTSSGEPSSEVRNWGNCYRLTTPDFSVLVLVDAGRDARGSVVDVAAQTRRERGPVDVVMSCLRRFPSPFFGGLARYFACLPFDELESLFRRYEAGVHEETTAGIEGAARACAAAGARFFLPYAHGFEGVGAPITDVGWGAGEASEATLLGELAGALRAVGASTRVAAWTVGARAEIGRSLRIESLAREAART